MCIRDSFEINNGEWYIVDLPGYGYAARGKKQRDEIRRIIEDYVLERPQMVTLFVLVDIRHSPQKIDLEFMEWLGEEGVPFSIVFTKADKISIRAAKGNIENYTKTLLEKWEELPPIFVTSAEKATGRDDLLGYIEELNREWTISKTYEQEEKENNPADPGL